MSSSEKIHQLLEFAGEKSKSLIVIQDMPDPDAIASAEALAILLKQKCGIESTIAHQGVVGRAENRGLLRFMEIELTQVSEVSFDDFDLISMVDTQPQFGNNSLPKEVHCNVVLDHHLSDDDLPDVDFADIRTHYGATSTILTEYLRRVGIRPDSRLSTALLYGIKSDTQDLGREATGSDTLAFLYLYPRADKQALAQIEHEGVPREYFRSLHSALERSRIYDRALVCYTGTYCFPEIVAEVADMLMRLGEVNYVLCYGICHGRILISLRTDIPDEDANGIMRDIVRGIGSGGGHRMFAGGQVPVDDATPSAAVQTIEDRFLTRLNLNGIEPDWLIPRDKTGEEESDGL